MYVLLQIFLAKQQNVSYVKQHSAQSGPRCWTANFFVEENIGCFDQITKTVNKDGLRGCRRLQALWQGADHFKITDQRSYFFREIGQGWKGDPERNRGSRYRSRRRARLPSHSGMISRKKSIRILNIFMPSAIGAAKSLRWEWERQCWPRAIHETVAGFQSIRECRRRGWRGRDQNCL